MIEYEQDNQFFIGEIKNGVRNGNGKEFDNFGRIIFEGQYINGTRNGKGKEFWVNFTRRRRNYLDGIRNDIDRINVEYNILFEGEYVNGERNGKGIEYDYGKVSFEGEYLYGFRIKRKEYINGKIEYEGKYLFNNKWHGKGFDEQGNIMYELINGNGKVKE